MSHHLYWRMNRLPFGHVDRREDFFEGSSQREALARLQFVAGNGSAVGLLLGVPGTGKTTLLDFVRRNMIWTDAIVEPVYLSGRVDDHQVWMRQLAIGLGAGSLRSTVESWQYIGDALDSLTRQDVHTCLLIDDATAEIAETVRVFVNRSRNITAILSTELESASRIVHGVGGCPLRIDLSPWTLDDSAAFIRHAVVAVDGSPDIFSDAAIVRLHELSEGRVATISRLGELALLAGAGAGVQQISSELIEAIQEEMIVAA